MLTDDIYIVDRYINNSRGNMVKIAWKRITSNNIAILQLLFDMKMFLLAGVDCKENVDNLLKRIDGEIAQLQQ